MPKVTLDEINTLEDVVTVLVRDWIREHGITYNYSDVQSLEIVDMTSTDARVLVKYKLVGIIELDKYGADFKPRNNTGIEEQWKQP